MAQFKVFPYRLHTVGGHTIHIWSEFSTPCEIMDYLKLKDFVDIFWTQSTNAESLAPIILRCSSVEIITPVFGRAGIVVTRDSLGNLIKGSGKSPEKAAQPKVAQSVKKGK